MKTLVILLLICFSFSLSAQDYVHEYNCTDSSRISYEELPSGIGSGRANRISKVVCNYFKSIADNDYDLWYSMISDSTKSKIDTAKFPRKFKRLVDYQIKNWNDKKVVSFEEISGKEFREKGTIYTMVIKLPNNTVIQNRVSFDPIKRVKMKDKEQYLGINIVESDDKVYQIFLHKYFTKANTPNQGNH